MRAVLERAVRSWWTGDLGLAGEALSIMLAPLSAAWLAATWWRNHRVERRGATEVDGVKVVSIGNLAVGGTGKTPLASIVARHLVARGARPAILLSGYGRDELLLHRRWTPELDVRAGRDRVRLARDAVADGASWAVLDDGFQHRSLARDLDVVLLAVEDDFPGRLLPRGPYREGVSALQRADAIIVTRRTASLEEAQIFVERVRSIVEPPAVVVGCIHLAPGRLSDLVDWRSGEAAWEGDASPEGLHRSAPALEAPIGVTGVARPEAFRRSLVALSSGEVDLFAFPDHHEIDFEVLGRCRKRAPGRPIVLTEKDAVTVGEDAAGLEDTWVLQQRVEWDWGRSTFFQLLDEHISGSAEIAGRSREA